MIYHQRSLLLIREILLPSKSGLVQELPHGAGGRDQHGENRVALWKKGKTRIVPV